MKKLTVNILCAVFLLAAAGGNLHAQSSSDGENYYSNPQKGINPTAPKPYSDTDIASKSDDIVVELNGTVKDTTPVKDTARLKLKSIPEYTRGDNPGYWGTSIVYSWDPWYSPYWNTWYHPGWGGSHWMLTYGWGWGPYWSFGIGYSWGWGSPWWYWDPWYSPYYAHYGYYGYYGYYGHYGWGGYAYGWGHRPYYGYGYDYAFGHHYLGSGNRGAAISPTSRNSGASPSPARPVRRGGVDLNNGGRAPRGSISGTGTRSNGSVATGNTSSRTRSNGTVGNGRYAKPASVASNRAARTASRSSYGTSQRGNVRPSSNGTRSGYSTPAGNSRFESGRTSGSSRTFNGSRQSSSRSTGTYSNSRSSSSSRSSSFGGSSSSRGGGYSGGSSSRSSGGFSGGSSSRGGGGSSSRR